MQEIEKEIISDYESKSVEIETITDDISFILGATLLIGNDANDVHAKALNYDEMQAHLPNLIDLLHYKLDEMKAKLDKLYNAKRDTKDHTEAGTLN